MASQALTIGLFLASAVIPIYVRRVEWVSSILLVGGFGGLLAYDRWFGNSVSELIEKSWLVLAFTAIAIMHSEVKFRRDKGWWRFLDGEAGKRRTPEDGAKHPN
jgi:hypothetical protein